MARAKRFFREFPARRLAMFAFISGCLAALGHAPWSLWPVSLLGFTGICFLHLRAVGVVNAAWTVWLSGVGYFGVSLFWIVEPFLVDIPKHGWMAPFALFLMSAGLALLWGAAGALAGRMTARFLRSIGLVATLSLFEMLRSVLFTGFPWALPAYVWSEHDLMQLSAWVGPFGLSVITLLISALSAYSILLKRRFVAMGLVVAFVVIWAVANQIAPEGPADSTGKTARLLQPNAAQHLKWQRDMIPVFFNKQLEMTDSAKADGIDLIVWPETAVGYRLNQTPEALDWIAKSADGVPIAFGGNSVIDLKFRNTMGVIGTNGEVSDWYYKHHLVPFGEYIPMGEVLGRVGIRGLAAQDGAGYDVGEGPRVLEIEGVGNVLPLICYELIFPRHLRTETRPDIILQITNDAWFGNISGPYQHLAQAKFRAVEQGLPVLRSANTGITAAIDPYGRITAQLELNTEGVLDVAIPAPLAPTLYSKTGDAPILILLLILVAGIDARSALGRRHV